MIKEPAFESRVRVLDYHDETLESNASDESLMKVPVQWTMISRFAKGLMEFDGKRFAQDRRKK